MKETYRITLEIVVRASDEDEAEERIKEIIQEGILNTLRNEEDNPLEEFEVVDIEPGEVY